MAGKPKGLPKSGGRVKGVPNKTSHALELHEKCKARGIDVFELLLDFCGEAPMELRLNAIKELMKYLYPQRKAIEHSGEINNPYLKMTVEELEKEVKAKLKEKKV